MLALVLPLSAAAGLSWQGFRKMIANNYTDLAVLSVAANGTGNVVFVRYRYGRVPGYRMQTQRRRDQKKSTRYLRPLTLGHTDLPKQARKRAQSLTAIESCRSRTGRTVVRPY